MPAIVGWVRHIRMTIIGVIFLYLETRQLVCYECTYPKNEGIL